MVYKIDYYEPDGDNYRYIIGTKGEHTLIAIGVNPNTATDKNPDKTISKTIEFSIRNGYDSFIAVNLYPQKAKFPKDLDKQEFQNQIQKYQKYLQKALRLPQPFFFFLSHPKLLDII